MSEFFQTFFGPGPFVPHGHCYLWHTPLVWLHVLSDSLIALAYYSIPIFLIALTRKRQDLPFRALFWLFGGFIISCGTTHWIEVATLWYPAYWLFGTIKAITALLSVWTALELIPLFPQAVALPSIEQYELANWALQREIAERRKVEASLRESEAVNARLSAAALQEKEDILRLFAQYAPAGIAMLDRDVRYVVASQRWVDEYNLGSVESLLQRSHYDVFPEIPERWRQVHQRCLAGAIEKCDDDLFVHPDGTQQWISWEIRPWHRATGEIGGIAIFSLDVTSRKLVEIKLRERERLFSTLAEALPVVVFRFDQESRCVYINNYWTTLTGRTTESVAGFGWVESLHPQDRDRLAKEWLEWSQNAQQRGLYQNEGRLVHLNGEDIWYYIQALPEVDTQGETVSFIGVMTDITARKQAEAVLQQLNAELEQRVADRTVALQTLSDRLMEAQAIAHVGSWEYDIVTNKVFWSDEIFRIFGLTPGEQEPDYESHLAQNFLSEDGQRLNECVMRALRQAEPYEVDLRMIRADGSTGWILAKGKPILNQHNQVVRVMGVALDITERKAIEEQQQRLSQLKDDFLSTVSHELRSPLASIKMAVHLLELNLNRIVAPLDSRVETQPQRLQQYLGILREQCDQELELVNNLLDLQRLEAEKIQVEMVPIDVNEWVSNIVKAFEARIQERQQYLEVLLPKALPPFLSDSAMLTHVLRELLTNACKYTPPGETITVEVCPTQDTFQLRVSNSGTQIEQEELERIFDKFYRIPKSDQWKQGGTGLGLALIKKQVEYLGGTLRAESNESGVHFIVQFGVDLP